MKGSTLNLGKNTYQIYYTTGVVLGKDRKTEVSTSTQVSGGGGSYYQGTGYSNPVSVTTTSKTNIQDDIFIQDEEGKERVISLYNFHIPCREGNKIIVAWIIKNNNETGPYVMVKNYTTDILKFRDEKIREVLSIADSWSETQKSLFGRAFFSVCALLIIIALLGFSFGAKFIGLLALGAFIALIYYSKKINNEIKANKQVVIEELNKLADAKK